MKKNSIITLFISSFYSFGSIAKFRTMGIGKTIQYVFFLALVYFLPGLLNAFNGNGMLASVPAKILIPFYLFFMYAVNAGVIFLKISIFAYVALLLSRMFQKKLVYRHAWRLTAFSLTMPTVLFSLLEAMSVHLPQAFLMDLLLSILIIALSVKQLAAQKN